MHCFSRSKLINITLFCQPHHRVVPSSAQIVSKCPPTLTVLYTFPSHTMLAMPPNGKDNGGNHTRQKDTSLIQNGHGAENNRYNVMNTTMTMAMI